MEENVVDRKVSISNIERYRKEIEKGRPELERAVLKPITDFLDANRVRNAKAEQRAEIAKQLIPHFLPTHLANAEQNLQMLDGYIQTYYVPKQKRVQELDMMLKTSKNLDGSPLAEELYITYKEEFNRLSEEIEKIDWSKFYLTRKYPTDTENEKTNAANAALNLQVNTLIAKALELDHELLIIQNLSDIYTHRCHDIITILRILENNFKTIGFKFPLSEEERKVLFSLPSSPVGKLGYRIEGEELTWENQDTAINHDKNLKAVLGNPTFRIRLEHFMRSLVEKEMPKAKEVNMKVAKEEEVVTDHIPQPTKNKEAVKPHMKVNKDKQIPKKVSKDKSKKS